MKNPLIFLFTVANIICLSAPNFIIDSHRSFEHISDSLVIKVENNNQRTVYTVQKFGRTIQRVHLNDGFGRRFEQSENDFGFNLHGNEQDIRYQVVEDSEHFSLVKVIATMNVNKTVQHCFDLNTPRLNWFGGPQYVHQYWPIEKLHLKDFSYVPKQQDNAAVAERYWLHSGKIGNVYD